MVESSVTAAFKATRTVPVDNTGNKLGTKKPNQYGCRPTTKPKEKPTKGTAYYFPLYCPHAHDKQLHPFRDGPSCKKAVHQQPKKV